MYSELGTTALGSMLVFKTHITSVYKAAAPVIENALLLLKPDWTHLEKKPEIGYQSQNSLLKENESLNESLCHSGHIICTHQLMEEHVATQLIIQDAHLNKLNQVLHTHEDTRRATVPFCLPKAMNDI